MPEVPEGKQSYSMQGVQFELHAVIAAKNGATSVPETKTLFSTQEG